MEWKETRRGEHHSRSNDEQIGYIVAPKRGKYYIKAYLLSGAEHRLPYQDFDTADEAKNWVEEYECKRAERNARHADEEPLKWW